MRKMMGALFVLGGGLLVIYGLGASDMFFSQVSRLTSGPPMDKSMWFVVGGAFAVLVGLSMAMMRGGHQPPKTQH